MNYFLTGGRVIDPFQGIDKKTSVYIRNGYIESMDKKCIPLDAEQIDVKGNYIIPGLIDSHIHVNQSDGGFGEKADLICIPNGVTGAIDAGSCGVQRIESFIEKDILTSTCDIYAILHVVSQGQDIRLKDEIANPNYFNEPKIIKYFQKYPQYIKGLKIRCHADSTHGFGLQSLRKTIEIANLIENKGLRCPVTMHLGKLEKDISLEMLLNELRPSDVVAHVFQSSGETIIEDNGKVRDCVKKARERGVLFDFAHGRINFTFSTMRLAIKDGFYPDLLGSDIHAENSYIKPAFSLMNTMTIMSEFGMPIYNIIRALTETPTKTYHLIGRTGLKIGSKANLSILQKTNKVGSIVDKMKDELITNAAFDTLLTMIDGKVVYQKNSL